jgi:shikimate dehydrogenase
MMTDDRPMTAGVCGHPIAQSKSPRLFQHWFEKYGIAGHYSPYLIYPDNFEKSIKGLIAAGLRGVNCTLPHKQAALDIADDVSDAAFAIGAANTLTFHTDGTIHADNTDAYGFYQNLRAGASNWTPEKGPVVMIGAGGAARAAIHILLEEGAPTIRLTNRTKENAEMLAAHFGGRVDVVNWSERDEALESSGLIVNSTSLGMIGQPPLDLRLDAAPNSAVVTDMVYNPLETQLLADARSRKMIAVDGLGMLLHQARPGFNRWFGFDPVVDDGLRTACLEGS